MSSISHGIERAREAILLQIAERDRDFAHEAPMFPWTRALKAMAYVFSLPEEHLRSIRLHCDIFLGENTPTQLFGPALDLPTYEWLGEAISSVFWVKEPLVPALGEALGYPVEGGALNHTSIFLQRYLCNLLRIGLSDGQHVIEIGPGYGGLAHAALIARNVRYTIIDLPETLIFSAAFLMHHFPNKRAYVYTPGDTPQAMAGADLVFLPNYRADWIEPFDIAINTVSFPEMGREALRGYINLLADRMRPDGFLMSVNYHGDRGDGLGVPDFLAERFDLRPTPAQLISQLDISDADYKSIGFRPTLIGVPHGRSAAHLARTHLRDTLNHRRVITEALDGGPTLRWTD